jgi:transcriptional regulator with AAA-type ATPase domain
MPLLTGSERAFLKAVSRLAYANPFLSERLHAERDALGEEFLEGEPIWSLRVDDEDRPHANVLRITGRLESLLVDIRERLALGGSAPAAERDLILYQDAALYLLHRAHHAFFRTTILSALEGKGPGRLGFYTNFLRDWERLLHVPGLTLPAALDASHVFACLFQIHRAYHHIFRFIVGSSKPAARLRAAVWQSIFTHDARRFRDILYEWMSGMSTLITGPSGTGKELVARAIGLSQYIPFDPDTKDFATDFTASFHPLNVAALPATLVESELFGHRKGAFTGAIKDRRGWFELCVAGGTIFLDEIGDLDPALQVKLLRVLQTRTFQPVGDTTNHEFAGKLITATNQDLGAAMHARLFREDLYYRLCSDVIVTPSLEEQLRDSPSVLPELVLFIAKRIAASDAEALADEVEQWIRTGLHPDYPWPGNIRELEQCVRSVMIHGEYQPARMPLRPALQDTLDGIEHGAFTADKLLSRYCTLVYSQTGNYQETARRLQLDRRTVKSKVDEELLARLREAR